MNLFLLAQAAPNAGAGGAGFAFAGFGLFILIFALIASIFWIWMLVDCLSNRSLQGAEKVVWILVILFLHLLGALIYFFIGRGTRSVT